MSLRKTLCVITYLIKGVLICNLMLGDTIFGLKLIVKYFSQETYVLGYELKNKDITLKTYLTILNDIKLFFFFGYQ